MVKNILTIIRQKAHNAQQKQAEKRKAIFDIIIPCYNAEKYLNSCLDSVAAQTLRDIHIICINDGSTDGTLSILNEWRKKDGRITVIDQNNQGVSCARNRGLKEASAQYVYFLDSDDEIYDAETLSRCCGMMTEKNADVLIGAAQTVFESDKYAENYSEFADRYRISNSYPGVLSGPESIAALRKNNDWSVPPGTQVMRRTFLEENRLSFLEGYIHEDGLFRFEVLYLAKRVIIVQDSLYKRRIREESIMTAPVTHRNTLGYIATTIEGLRFIEAHREISMQDVITGRSVGVFRRMAAKTYNRLDRTEKDLLMKNMTKEQRFFFENFVKEDAQLMRSNEQMQKALEENKEKA